MNNLQPIEFNNQRILTTEQLAEVYETDVNNIRNNFNNHKENFIEGKHYYFLKGEELKDFKDYINDIDVVQKNTPSLYLWTERGANRHCKILDTDKAWEQFDNLEETYFKVKENQIPKSDDEIIYIGYGKAIEKIKMLEQKIVSDKPKTLFADAVASSKTSILVGELAKILKQNGADVGQNRSLMLKARIASDSSISSNFNLPFMLDG